jgi:hypothetical protein
MGLRKWKSCVKNATEINMTEYDNELTFVLFLNDKKNENQPDRWGFATVGGVEYKMSGWNKQTKRGDTISGKLTPPQEDDYKPEPVDEEAPF